MTLTEFLLVRIAEDEAAAKACPPWPWRISTLEDETNAHDEQTFAGEAVTAADGIAVAVPYALSAQQERAVRDHIVRHDPARVLAECEVKRRVVENTRFRDDPRSAVDEWLATAATWDSPYPLTAPREIEHLIAICKLLALPYANHPDYDEGWRP